MHSRHKSLRMQSPQEQGEKALRKNAQTENSEQQATQNKKKTTTTFRAVDKQITILVFNFREHVFFSPVSFTLRLLVRLVFP